MTTPTNGFDERPFLPSEIFSYLEPNPEQGTSPKLLGIAKRFPQHFRVLERAAGMENRFLTIGPESDYPASVLSAPRTPDSVVVASMVKERTTTWAAIDWLASLLSKATGRRIQPEQIRHSGLKDRWAETVATVAIYGVSLDEVCRVAWPYFGPGKAGFFLKDIRWHDARQRLHPVADERRNIAWTEVTARVKMTREIPATELCAKVCEHLSKELGRTVNRRDVKMNGATPSHRNVFIGGMTVAEMLKVTWPADLGFTLEAPRLVRSNFITKGAHRLNRFELKIVIKNQDKASVESYLLPRLEKLARRQNYVPNAINMQRLAARQKGHLDGYTLITGDYPAPKGVHAFGTASEAALYRFLFETTGRENPAAEELRRDIEGSWLYDFPGMKRKLERNDAYRQLNMSVEYKIAERLADIQQYRGDFQAVVASMSEECSLWIAAWQSYWWNQVLGRKLPHWVKQMELAEQGRTKFDPSERGIPTLMDTVQARQYYERLPYCKEALNHLRKADPFIRDQFLKPFGNKSPWRNAFIRVDGLSHSVNNELVDGNEQTVVNISFNLPAGAYATTFLGFLFELEEPNKGANRASAGEAETPDLEEGTE